MSSPAEITRGLRELAENLRNDGIESAAFFEMLAETIEEAWPSSQAYEQLERLATSGAIRQYASFTVGQNALYERCLLLANQLIASGPSGRA